MFLIAPSPLICFFEKQETSSLTSSRDGEPPSSAKILNSYPPLLTPVQPLSPSPLTPRNATVSETCMEGVPQPYLISVLPLLWLL